MEGLSEILIREAVINRYPRDKVYVATKMPMWEVKTSEDFDRIFEEQLVKVGVILCQ